MDSVLHTWHSGKQKFMYYTSGHYTLFLSLMFRVFTYLDMKIHNNTMVFYRCVECNYKWRGVGAPTWWPSYRGQLPNSSRTSWVYDPSLVSEARYPVHLHPEIFAPSEPCWAVFSTHQNLASEWPNASSRQREFGLRNYALCKFRHRLSLPWLLQTSSVSQRLIYMIQDLLTKKSTEYCSTVLV